MLKQIAPAISVVVDLSRRVLFVVCSDFLGFRIANTELVDSGGNETKNGSVDGGVGEAFQWSQSGVVAVDSRCGDASYRSGAEQPLVGVDDSGCCSRHGIE